MSHLSDVAFHGCEWFWVAQMRNILWWVLLKLGILFLGKGRGAILRLERTSNGFSVSGG